MEHSFLNAFPKSMQILLDGKPSCIDISESALSQFDGVFETILVKQREPVFWDKHLQRLRRGCDIFHLTVPSFTELYNELRQSLQDAKNAVIKIIVFQDNEDKFTKRIVAAKEYPEEMIKKQQVTGVRLMQCVTQLPNQITDCKNLHRNYYIQAKEEIKQAGMDDGLLCDYNNRIIESTIANPFLVKESSLMTPDLSHTGVKGIMREAVMTAAKLKGFSVIEKNLSLQDCLEADELFLTNSLRGVLPIVFLQQRDFPIGKVTRLLQDILCPI